MESGDITRVVNGLGGDDEREALSDEIYEHLRICVRSVLTKESSSGRGPNVKQDLTVVVHECWLKLQSTANWENRAHYFGAASRATRQILIDMARKRTRAPRVFSYHDNAELQDDSVGMDLDLSSTLDRVGTVLEDLESIAPRAARIASYRLFGDLPTSMIAEEEGISQRMVQRDWKFAQAWLASRLTLSDILCQTASILSPLTNSNA
tara:strand:- start:260171 stop:260794 length:624 start_codon:yes stop_codon:yes gene_type:complete